MSLMLSSDRPKPSQSKRRRIFEGAELEQTGLRPPTRGGPCSPSPLTWVRASRSCSRSAGRMFAWRTSTTRRSSCVAGRSQRRAPADEDGRFGADSADPSGAGSDPRASQARGAFRPARPFVFSTRLGGPLRQRNVCRALRNAQRDAVDDLGRPTFRVLNETDEAGRPVPVAHGELPSMDARGVQRDPEAVVSRIAPRSAAVRDLVHRRLPNVSAGVPKAKREIGQHEAAAAPIDVEHHPVVACRWRQVDLDAMGQAGPVRALRLARP